MAQAQEAFIAGTHYQELALEQTQVETDSQIQVQHWFWYGCPSCTLFARELPKLKADDLQWQSYPARLRPHWYFHAKAYHFAIQQENAAELEQALYAALNENGNALSDQEALESWFETQGIEPDLVADRTTSPLLNQKLAKELKLQQKLQIKGVPALVIDGRYLVDASMVKSLDEFLAVTQFLLQQARQDRVQAQAKAESKEVHPSDFGADYSNPLTLQ